MRTEAQPNCRTNPARARKIWLTHVNAWQQSGLSRAEYSRQHNLSHHQLRYWQKKNELQESPGLTFVPVPLASVVKHSTRHNTQEWKSFLKVEINGRFKVEVADEFSPAILARLITTLEGC
nr:hypothetical protein [Desulfobulbaceae bacterium]